MKTSKILAWVFATITLVVSCLVLVRSVYNSKENKALKEQLYIVKRVVDMYESGHGAKLNRYYEILLKLGDGDSFNKDVLFFRVKHVCFNVSEKLTCVSDESWEIRVPKSRYIMNAKYLTVINFENSLKTIYFTDAESVKWYQLNKE